MKLFKPLPYFLSFNAVFFLLQCAFIFSKNQSFADSIPLPFCVYLEFIRTFFVHIGLYILLSVAQTLLMAGLHQKPWDVFSQNTWIIIIWICSVCALLSANAYFFPLSQFSSLLPPPIPLSAIKTLLILSLSLFGLFILHAFLFYLRQYPHHTLLILSPVLGLVLFFQDSDTTSQTQNTSKRPNIILIGIDSLTPASITSQNMPHLTSLLQHSLQFSNTISPLAKTHPAWTSILTGLYPKNHGALENLVPASLVKNKQSIAWALQAQGYHTIFATDERRFSKIDENMGFQSILGPKVGVNDILLGTFNDFPLGNLLINFPISRWLFPYNYLNRASYFSYYPDSFDKQLKKALTHNPVKSPLFLGAHFTLAHWPYAWAESPSQQIKNKYHPEAPEMLYATALKRVDKQVYQLYKNLEKAGYLENCLLVLLSDHGETLHIPHSRSIRLSAYQGHQHWLETYFKKYTATEFDKSAGHGSDLLSPKQFQSLLAFTLFQQGKIINYKKKIGDRVALIDIAPTLYDFLQYSSKPSTDGLSLLPFIYHSTLSPPRRSFFLESGMLPNQAFSDKKVMIIAKQFFVVEAKHGELLLKTSQLPTIIAQKLYGVMDGEWLLALYPVDKQYLAIIYHIPSGLWTDEPLSGFAKTTPLHSLLIKLENFYHQRFPLITQDVAVI